MSNAATRNVASAQHPFKQKYSIIIPAAGIGTRMRSYGPKCLLKVRDESILQRQINIISNTFISFELIVVGGFEAHRVKRKVPKAATFLENEDYESTNVVHSIALGLERATTNNVLIIYGDLFFSEKALDLPLYKRSLLTLTNDMKDEEVGCTSLNNVAQNLMYDLSPKWGQMVYLTGYELAKFKQLVTTTNCSYMFGFEIINKIINEGGIFQTFLPKNSHILDIDTSRDIAKAKEYV